MMQNCASAKESKLSANLCPGKFTTLSFSLHIYEMNAIIHVLQFFSLELNEKAIRRYTLAECLILLISIIIII